MAEPRAKHRIAFVGGLPLRICRECGFEEGTDLWECAKCHGELGEPRDFHPKELRELRRKYSLRRKEGN